MLLKVSCASHTSDVRELRCGHPCYIVSVIEKALLKKQQINKKKE
jgi:hypothetical protein